MIPLENIRQWEPDRLKATYSKRELKAAYDVLSRHGAKGYIAASQGSPMSSDSHMGGITPYDSSQDFFSLRNLNALASNVGPSAINLITGLADAATSPIETYDSIKEMGMQGIINELDDRLGTIDNFKRTAVEDPFGIALDLAPIGGGIGGRVAGQLAKSGSRTARLGGVGVGAVTDPAGTLGRAAGSAVGATGHAIGEGYHLGTALISGMKPQLLKRTVSGGSTKKGRQQFRDIINKVHDEDILFNELNQVGRDISKQADDFITQALDAMPDTRMPELIKPAEWVNVINDVFRGGELKRLGKEKGYIPRPNRSAEFVSRQVDSGWKNAKGTPIYVTRQFIKFKPDKSLYETVHAGTGVKRALDPDQLKAITDLESVLRAPFDYTPKQAWKIYTQLESISSYATKTQGPVFTAIGRLRKVIRDQLSAHPEYGSYMKEASKRYELLDDLDKLVGLKVKGQADTQQMINKFITMANEGSVHSQGIVNKFKELSTQVMGEPIDLNATAAGLAMRQPLPQSLVARGQLMQGITAGAGVGAAVGVIPFGSLWPLLILLPMSSPKLLGKFNNILGIGKQMSNQIQDINRRLWKKPVARALGKKGYTIGSALAYMAEREQEKKGSK